MTYIEYDFTHNQYYDKLQSIYNSIEPDINTNTPINKLNLEFNVFQGDITKDIKWTWASNLKTLKHFCDFFTSINLKEKLLHFSKKEFIIRGASFITLNKSIIQDSEFHLDAVSHYDTAKTNILTIIFPLFEIQKNVGGLEYKENEETKIYKYNTNKIIIWDSCKFQHRTQPYNVEHPVKRVLVSVNLSTNYDWSKKVINNSLQYQGNKLLIE